ncbi:hypothetical protein BTVI_147790 [Pitangus sulphuratus]|nr:hypothetical protein BTVI_147790 [Pitangus sulphuratus]
MDLDSYHPRCLISGMDYMKLEPLEEMSRFTESSLKGDTVVHQKHNTTGSLDNCRRDNYKYHKLLPQQTYLLLINRFDTKHKASEHLHKKKDSNAEPGMLFCGLPELFYHSHTCSSVPQSMTSLVPTMGEVLPELSILGHNPGI